MSGFKILARKLVVGALTVGIGGGVLFTAYSCGDVAMEVGRIAVRR